MDPIGSPNFSLMCVENPRDHTSEPFKEGNGAILRDHATTLRI